MSLDLFITAAGTEIGKTWVAEQLIGECRQRGVSCEALKPIVTGFDDSPDSDTARLLRALALPVSEHTVAACSPWRFAEPMSPHMAARRAGRMIALHEVVAFCKQPSEARLRLIEGVGGVMVPVNEDATTADWIAALGIPAVLVVGSYLGSISHALTAFELLRTRDIAVQGVVVNESVEQPIELAATVATIERFCAPTPVVATRRGLSDPNRGVAARSAALLEALQLWPG